MATTTPTRKEKELDEKVGHFVSDIEEYNQRLIERLGNKVDYINDLFSVVIKDRENIIKQDDLIHLTEYGKEVCANQVVKAILSVDK